jgi:glycosyltransferase involved in cell wall biosynthesis
MENGKTMKKILVAGPVFSRSGYGEHARFVVNALSSRPDLFDVYIYPLEWGHSNWTAGDQQKSNYYAYLMEKTAKHIQQSKGWDVHIQVTIPSEWVSDVAPCNIGITAGVETDRLPESWKPNILQMDKVIVTSTHIKKLFDKVLAGNKNIEVEAVAYPVKELVPTGLDSQIQLDADFNFLTIAQYAPRKNLLNTIKWFVEEFREDEVGLVVKSHMRNNSYPDSVQLDTLLRGFVGQLGPSKCQVYLLTGTMSDQEVHGLYIHPKIKAYVTATHGEGFGLPLYEAAYSGLPIIAPAWSGQTDFLYCPFKKRTGKIERRAHFEKVGFEVAELEEIHLMPNTLEKGMKWCYPKEKKFKKAMRDVYNSPIPREKTAEHLKEYLVDTFSDEKQLKKMWTAINEGIGVEKNTNNAEVLKVDTL